jgi:urea carboxylase system permease
VTPATKLLTFPWSYGTIDRFLPVFVGHFGKGCRMREHGGSDSEQLAQFGYKQELDRRLGKFSSFAAGFSYISILTGMFQLFAFGYFFGGPAVWWAWVLVFTGQFLVALCFAELAARYPIAGSVYQWSKHIGNSFTSFMAGWVMLIASIVTVSAVAVAWQIILPQISTKFQFVGPNVAAAPFTSDGAKNAVILGLGLIVATTVINIIGINVMAKINNVGVMVELIGASLLIVLLLFNAQRGPQVVFDTLSGGYHASPGYATFGYLAAFLIAAIMPAYVMYGFDTAGSLAEETNDPRRTAPRMLLTALGTAGIAGALLLLTASMAASNLRDENLGVVGLPFIVKDVLGETLGNILLWAVVVSIAVCCLAIHTAAVRIMFSMARDNALPFGSHLARVSSTRKTPALPAIIVGVLSGGILVVNIGNQSVFTVVTGVAIVMIYTAYLFVTVPLLFARMRGWPHDKGADGLFTLGAWGMLVNSVAIVYGAAMALNIVWPRNEIYNFYPPFTWYWQYGGVLFVGFSLVLGGIVYYVWARQNAGVLAEHRPEPAQAAPETVA